MESRKKVTIRDVAQASGFSVYTVSSVLNNKGDISRETSRKVRETAERLNYHLLDNVGALRRISMRSIGIVLPDAGCFQHEFYNRAVSTFSALATKHRYDCQFYTENDIKRKLDPDSPDGLHSIGSRGLIVFCPRQDYEAYVGSLLDRGIAVALIRRRCAEREGLIQLVDDDLTNMRKVLSYAYDVLGSRRMIMLTKSGDPGAREEAFYTFIRQKLAENEGILMDLMPMNEPEKLREFKRFIMGGVNTTMFCWTDAMAMRTLFKLKSMGISVPEDLNLTGYNDDPVATSTVPGITTMRIPIEEMVTAACEALFDLNEPATLPAARTQVFEHSLVLRGSTASASATWPDILRAG